MKIIHVVGARPNFMKIAPIIRACNASENIEQILVHTGQHYDEKMSDLLFSSAKYLRTRHSSRGRLFQSRRADSQYNESIRACPDRT